MFEKKEKTEDELFKNEQKDEFLEDNYYSDEFSSEPTEETYKESPHMDSETFEKRNNPKKLLKRFKLQLMQAYEVKVPQENKVTGKVTFITKIKHKKNTSPKCNKQGQEDIISHFEKYINGHSVQGHFPKEIGFITYMRFVSKSTTTYFISKRKEWEMSIADCSEMIDVCVDFIEMFMSRTLFNEERRSYVEGFKEITNIERKPEVKKPSALESLGKSFYGLNK